MTGEFILGDPIEFTIDELFPQRRKFVCAQCKVEYDTFTTEDEKTAERRQNFPDGRTDDLVSVCDSCYAAVLARLGKLP